MLSGVVRAIVWGQLGFRCGWMEESSFYLSNDAAILVETAFQSAFKKFTGGHGVNAIVSSTIGYFWVFVFLFHSLPRSQYGKVFCVPE